MRNTYDAFLTPLTTCLNICLLCHVVHLQDVYDGVRTATLQLLPLPTKHAGIFSQCVDVPWWRLNMVQKGDLIFLISPAFSHATKRKVSCNCRNAQNARFRECRESITQITLRRTRKESTSAVTNITCIFWRWLLSKKFSFGSVLW